MQRTIQKYICLTLTAGVSNASICNSQGCSRADASAMLLLGLHDLGWGRYRPLEKRSMSSFRTPVQSVLHSLLGGLRWGSSWGSVWEMKNVFNTTKQRRNTREWRSLWDRDRLEDRLEIHSFTLGMRSHSFFIRVKTKTRVRVVFPMVYSGVYHK